MAKTGFDDQNIIWNAIEGFEHIAYHILNVDEEARIVDVLFRFAANQRIALHRHMADYFTLVLDGELRLYRPDGALKEVRPVGSYVAGFAGGEPHSEGGGDRDAIVYFTNRNVTGPIYEILGDCDEVVATFGVAEFRDLMAAQAQKS